MTLQVDDYLAWTPADMEQGAVWLTLKATDMEMAASAVRNAAADGTAGQCGPFVESRRAEASEIADRIGELADLLRGARTEIRNAGSELESLVGLLRADCLAIEDEGFERVDGVEVRDARTEYANGQEREVRTNRARELKARLIGRLGDLRARDEAADQALHQLVDRPVRDRTPEGNGDPSAAGISAVTGITAMTEAAAALAERQWAEAARSAGRGLVTVRGLGPIAAALGFAGGVAARPEDEPLFEAIVAEGVGTVAGGAGVPLGILLGAQAGPLGAAAGGLGGFFAGPYAGQWASSKAREWFDNAN